MSKSKIGVDPDCVKLARSFLMDQYTEMPVSEAQAARDLKSLSEDIQRAIEDWFYTYSLPKDPGP